MVVYDYWLPRWEELVEDDKRDALEMLENRKGDQRELERATRLIAFSTRLFDGFRNDITIELPPPGWKHGRLPTAPLDYELEIEKRLKDWKHRFSDRCPYWFVRRALYAAFKDIEQIEDDQSVSYDLPLAFGDVAEAADRVWEYLEKLQDALENVRKYQCEDPVVPIFVHDALDINGNKRPDPSQGYLLRFPRGYTTNEIFDPKQIEQFSSWCATILEQAEKVKYENPAPRGKRVDLGKVYFAHFVGLIWLFVTGDRPTYGNTSFQSFLNVFEDFFWDEGRGYKVRHAADQVAGNFAAWNIVLPLEAWDINKTWVSLWADVRNRLQE
jgi:hypothetical protein